MSHDVVRLAAPDAQDVDLIGGKAAALAELASAGFPVPSAICVTTAAFRRATDQHWAAIDSILARWDCRETQAAHEAAARIAALLESLTVPPDVMEEVRAGLETEIGAAAQVAVRSSAIGEDRADVSFAGQYETVLGVGGLEAIGEAILTCWRSFFRPHALHARAQRGIGSGDAMAVLVQCMVNADCAGVCFTVDPIEERRDRLILNAAWGLGSGVVDGSVPADTLWLERQALTVTNRRVPEKTLQVTLDGTNGIREMPVPEERRRAACLPDSWAQRIGQFGIAAEQLLGRPQDVEWAIADGHLWILQSRPLTGLPAALARTPDFPVEWDADEDRRRLWRLNFFSRERLTLPFENDYLDATYAGWDDGDRFLGETESTRWTIFNGRRYFATVANGLHPGDTRVRQAAMDRLNHRLLQDEGKTAWDYWGPEVESATQRLAAFDVEQAGGADLAEHLEDALGAARRHLMVHSLLWRPPIDPYLAAFRRVSGLSGAEAERGAEALMHGAETPFTRLIDRLYELARLACDQPALCRLVADPPSDAYERLSALPEAAPFLAALDDFLQEYGDRTGAGQGTTATFMTPTWREDPTVVLRLIAPYLAPAVPAPADQRAAAERKREARVEELCRACTDPEAVAEFRRQLALVRCDMAVLEIHNHYIDQMAPGQVRRAVLAAGTRLAAQGVIDDHNDVFWLHLAEITAALRAQDPASLDPLIARRKEEHARWSALDPPPILGTPSAALEPRPAFRDEVTEEQEAEPGRLAGQGASAGRVQGRARVVPAAVVVPDLDPGDILVSTSASPVWTPFFPILGGIVLEAGSVGLHPIATAREYGIPAVIGVRAATSRIADGDQITVDGMTGQITLGVSA